MITVAIAVCAGLIAVDFQSHHLISTYAKSRTNAATNAKDQYSVPGTISFFHSFFYPHSYFYKFLILFLYTLNILYQIRQDSTIFSYMKFSPIIFILISFFANISTKKSEVFHTNCKNCAIMYLY